MNIKEARENEILVVNQIYDLLQLTEGDLSREFIHIALSDIKTFDSKQHDYGSANIAEFGEKGVLVRVNDKVARLKNLLLGEKKPSNESIEDSWGDTSVYGVIARLCRRKLWPKV